MSHVSPEQIVSVCEEIQHLKVHWIEGNLGARDIRAGSVAIRRLLVNNELIKVWHALIGEQKFIIPSTRIVVDHEELLRFYDLYTCTTAKHMGMEAHVLMAFMGQTIMTPIGDGKFKDETVYGAHIESSDMSLNQFLESVCIIAEGRLITRNWAVQYVANSLGGAHFGDYSRKGQKFDAAMAKLKQFDVGDLPVSVREVLGIGQALCNSQSCMTLMSAYEEWRKFNPHIRVA